MTKRNTKDAYEHIASTLQFHIRGYSDVESDIVMSIHIERALQKLKDAYPEIEKLIELKYYEELTQEEMCEITGLNRQVLRTRIRKGEDQIREYLEH